MIRSGNQGPPSVERISTDLITKPFKRLERSHVCINPWS
jgi:hypothetical protein